LLAPSLTVFGLAPAPVAMGVRAVLWRSKSEEGIIVQARGHQRAIYVMQLLRQTGCLASAVLMVMTYRPSTDSHLAFFFPEPGVLTVEASIFFFAFFVVEGFEVHVSRE
jgi:hypothetical protein